jgi:hypothetical protein
MKIIFKQEKKAGTVRKPTPKMSLSLSLNLSLSLSLSLSPKWEIEIIVRCHRDSSNQQHKVFFKSFKFRVERVTSLPQAATATVEEGLSLAVTVPLKA